MAKKKSKIVMMECVLCKSSILHNSDLHCKLRINTKPSIYSKVTMVAECVFFKPK